MLVERMLSTNCFIGLLFVRNDLKTRNSVYLLRSINLRLNSLEPRLRYWALRALVKVFGYTNEKFEVSFFGSKYRGQLRNHIDFLTFFFGSYERGIIKFLEKSILTTDMIVLDIGANVGHHTLFFSSQVKHVYSFEPYAKVRSLLEEKIRTNRIFNVEIVPFGLSSQTQTLEYFEPNEHNSGTGSFQPEYYSENKRTGILLELITGDGFIQQRSIKKIDFVKIDVEGFEHFVLEGMNACLNESRPIVMMEFGKQTQEYCKSPDGLFGLFPSNYVFYKLGRPFTSMATLDAFDFYSPRQVNLIGFPAEKRPK